MPAQPSVLDWLFSDWRQRQQQRQQPTPAPEPNPQGARPGMQRLNPGRDQREQARHDANAQAHREAAIANGTFKNTEANPYYASSRFPAPAPDVGPDSELMAILNRNLANPAPLPPQAQAIVDSMAAERQRLAGQARVAQDQVAQVQNQQSRYNSMIGARPQGPTPTPQAPPNVIAPPVAMAQAQPQGPAIPGLGTAATAVPHGPPARPMNPNLIMATGGAPPNPSQPPAPNPFYIPQGAVIGGQMPAAPAHLPPPGPAPTHPIPASPQSTPIPAPAPNPALAAAITQGARPQLLGPPPGFTPPAGGANPAPAGPAYGYRAQVPTVDPFSDNSTLPGVIAAQRFMDSWPVSPPPEPPPQAKPPAIPPVRSAPPAPPAEAAIPPESQPKPDPATRPRLGEAMPEALKEQLLAEAMRIVRERPKAEGQAPARNQPTLGVR